MDEKRSPLDYSKMERLSPPSAAAVRRFDVAWEENRKANAFSSAVANLKASTSATPATTVSDCSGSSSNFDSYGVESSSGGARTSQRLSSVRSLSARSLPSPGRSLSATPSTENNRYSTGSNRSPTMSRSPKTSPVPQRKQPPQPEHYPSTSAPTSRGVLQQNRQLSAQGLSMEERLRLSLQALNNNNSSDGHQRSSNSSGSGSNNDHPTVTREGQAYARSPDRSPQSSLRAVDVDGSSIPPARKLSNSPVLPRQPNRISSLPADYRLEKPSASSNSEHARPGAYTVRERAAGLPPSWDHHTRRHGVELHPPTTNSPGELVPPAIVSGDMWTTAGAAAAASAESSSSAAADPEQPPQPSTISRGGSNSDNLPTAEAAATSNKKGKTYLCYWATSLLILIVAAVVIGLWMAGKEEQNDPINSSDATDSADHLFSGHYGILRARLEGLSSDGSVLDDTSSPQGKALSWLAEEEERKANITDGVITKDSTNLEARYALAVLYFSSGGTVDGDDDETSGWWDRNQFLSSSHECNWTARPGKIEGGISCDSSQQVNGISIVGNGLKGRIPEELAALTGLETLTLRENALNGIITSGTWRRMTNLKFLDLSQNLLTSTEPLLRLSRLQTVRLGFNQLEGGFPKQLAMGPSMVELNLTHNKLSGPPLGEVNCFPTCADNILLPPAVLDISHCEFTGTMPMNHLIARDLLVLKFDNNRITGTLPFEMWKHLPKIQEFSGSDNTLSGDMPWLFLPNSLVFLDLSLNFMTSLFAFSPPHNAFASLEYVDLSDNLIGSTTFPESIGKMSQLKELHLVDLHLEGSLPSSLDNLRNLEQLNLSKNRLSGTLPSILGNLGSLVLLDLSDNRLTGSLPSALGNLLSLETLAVSENKLVGTIPAELGNCTSLMQVALQKNDLTGRIPEELTALTSLTHIALYDNDLHGFVVLCALDPDHKNTTERSVQIVVRCSHMMSRTHEDCSCCTCLKFGI